MPDQSTQRGSDGVCFPEGGDGHRSTQATGRAIFADSARRVDPQLAARIEHTNNWRSGYLTPIRDIVRAAAQPGDAVTIARDGLASAHQRFRFRRGGQEQSLASAMAQPTSPLESVQIRGTAQLQPDFSLPYRGKRLFGPELRAQVDSWVDDGIAEPGLADAVHTLMDNPQWMDLRDLHVAVLGAGAEMGPTRSLLRWGATVHAVDLPGADNWQRLIGIARSTAGSLRVPISTGSQGRAPVFTGGLVHPDDDQGVAACAGVNLLTQTPEIAAWLAQSDEPLVVGTYAYADGAQHVLLSVAADAIVQRLLDMAAPITLAYLATPTDVFIVPPAAVAQSQQRWQQRGLTGLLQSPLRIVRQFQPNYPATQILSDGRGINDSLVPQQGPNYALAKRLQRWRGVAALADETPVSANLAPATRTRSVVRNRVLAAAYAGADNFGVEVFEPATSTALMAALLVYDLRTRGSSTAPQPKGEAVFTSKAVHGGLWRTAYSPRSVLGVAAVLGMFESRG